LLGTVAGGGVTVTSGVLAALVFADSLLMRIVAKQTFFPGQTAAFREEATAFAKGVRMPNRSNRRQSPAILKLR
jgi:hypothetical protein